MNNKIDININNFDKYKEILKCIALHDYYISNFNYNCGSDEINITLIRSDDDEKYLIRGKEYFINHNPNISLDTISNWLHKKSYCIVLKKCKDVKMEHYFSIIPNTVISSPIISFCGDRLNGINFNIEDNSIVVALELIGSNIICYSYYCESVEIIVP